MNKELNSFPAAMLDFFGKLTKADGTLETSVEFMGELKALTDTDKAEFREMLKGAGYSKLS